MSEHEPAPGTDRQHPARRWKIPPRIRGRARTSTVAIGLCFVLTALLYGQIRPEPAGTVPQPQPTGPSEVPQEATQQPETPATEEATTTTGASTTSVVPGVGTDTVEPSTSSGSASVTTTPQGPTVLPGIPVPPQLLSVLPPTPSGTGTR